MREAHGIVRRSAAGVHVVHLSSQSAECVARFDPRPASRLRGARTSVAYRISQVIAAASRKASEQASKAGAPPA